MNKMNRIYTFYMSITFYKMPQNINNKNDDSITNTAGAFQSDGRDIEFSQELADHDDLVAQERSKAANQRAKARKNNNNK